MRRALKGSDTIPPRKSDNLQYDMLARWVAGTNDLLTKRLMFQVLCFKISLYTLFSFCNLKQNSKKRELKGFLHRILQDFMKKNNAWNIRRLVDETFVPSVQQTSVLYCRLSDFCTDDEHLNVKRLSKA